MAKKAWSYSAGVRGVNRVRVYEDGPHGALYAEWYDAGKRQRVALGALSRGQAVEKAEAMAEGFAELARARAEASAAPLTVPRLLDLYLAEVTPTKGQSAQGHDRRAARMFGQRFAGRAVETLNARDWRSFIADRRAGRAGGTGEPVRDRVIEYDLVFMVSVLNWAEGAPEGEPQHIAANPWSRTRRKAQRMAMPRERNPKRPPLTADVRELLLAHLPNWRARVVLELVRETMHRRNSVRQLAWADVDLAAGTVRWRGELDKNGLEAVTPLTARALEVLRGLPRVLGSPWVVPSPADKKKPVSISALNLWMQRAKARALRDQDPAQRARLAEQLAGLGYHAGKRAGVRDPAFRALPAAMREGLTSTSAQTLDRIYDDVSLDEMKDAVAGLGLRNSA